MRPHQAQVFVSDPPLPALGMQGSAAIGAQRGVQSPWTRELRQSVGIKLPRNGSPAWLAPKNAGSTATAKSFLPSQGKGMATTQHKNCREADKGLGASSGERQPLPCLQM